MCAARRSVFILERGGFVREEPSERPHHMAAAGLRLLAVCMALAALFQLRAGAVLLDASAVARAAAAAGETRMVIPSGRAVGIKLFSDGVLVVGLAEVGAQEKSSPAKECGLRVGDIITHVDGEEVSTIEEVQEVIRESDGESMQIRALRNGQALQFTAAGAEDENGTYKLGAWLRDSMAGIGTVTFYEPDSGLFAALGHGINDIDTAMLMPLESGSIMYASVTDVKRGQSGSPGELHGTFRVNDDLGSLFANTSSGVFGVLEQADVLGADAQPVEVVSRDEVQVGRAVIRSNIAGEQVEEYEVEITRVYPASAGETRSLMLKVTDQRLLDATGGIVQGMSGSPILQNGKLVGAVTHVLVDDPTTGYGILAENMLNVAKNSG